MTGSAHILRGDALALPLADRSVDLIVTSPPYFALRSYTDGGEHYAGQLGSEATPAEFVDALLEVTAECVRVLKPSGSLWVNLGDKYAGGGGGGDGSSDGTTGRAARPSRREYQGLRAKSLMGIPWRYAIRCIDDLGLILRAEVIWSKPNGLPESVTDRVRRSHEQWFHFTVQPRYFSAVDEIREPHAYPDWLRARPRNQAASKYDPKMSGTKNGTDHPFGKLPGSVWTVPTEPLQVPDELGVDHFAAFPTEWPRRLILGWSPSGVCTACGEGRRPVVADRPTGTFHDHANDHEAGRNQNGAARKRRWLENQRNHMPHISGYACACPEPDAPTTPAVVLDPFGGTGTTALVAKALGRTGISVDMSADYCRLAQWRVNDPDQLAKASRVAKPPRQIDGQIGFELEGLT